ncbi:MAG: type II and III secretion system protein family protein [Janthinobacterium lividum]
MTPHNAQRNLALWPLLLLCSSACAQARLLTSEPQIPATAPTIADQIQTSLFAPPTRKAAAQATAVPVGVDPVPTRGSSRYQVQHPAKTDTLHILAGQSLVLHSAVPMKRVFVGNPVIASAFNSSSSDLLVTGKEAGVTSLAVWDANGSNQLCTVSVDLDPTEMQTAVDGMYPGAGLVVTGVADRLELSGIVPTQEVADGLGKLGASYAKLVANSLRVMPLKPQQVELKLQIIEVDRSKLDQFGLNFSRGGNTPTSVGTGAFNSPLNLSIGYLKESISLNIQALAQQSVLQILAEPTLTTLSGGTAKFLSGGEFPIPVVQGTAAAGGAPTVTIQFRPYGVKVDFLPIINVDGSIRLKVAPEVSTLDYANAVTISGFTVPALSTRRADTEIELKDGQSFVLSGLLDRRATENLGRVPGISKVPILGELFRSHNNTHSLTELVFVVTANIIDPLHDTPPIERPVTVSPYMTQQQFDDEAHRKQATGPNR